MISLVKIQLFSNVDQNHCFHETQRHCFLKTQIVQTSFEHIFKIGLLHERIL